MFNNLKREIEKDFDRNKNFQEIVNRAEKKRVFNWKYVFAPAFAGIVVGVLLLNVSQTMKKENLKLELENTVEVSKDEPKVKKEWIIKKVTSNPEVITEPLIATVTSWEKKSSAEKFYNIEYDGRSYNGAKNISISENKLAQNLGEFMVTTLNSETSATVQIVINIFKIKNVNEKAAIAVKFVEDDNYYVYKGMDYIPDNLNEIIYDLNLKENASFDYVNYYEWFGEGKLDYNYIEFIDVEDEVIWDFLNNLNNSNLKTEDRQNHKRLMGININLENLGLGKLNFITILEDGYVSSTLLANKCYYIGEDKTEEFIEYIMEKYDGYLYVYDELEPQADRIMTIENKVGAEPQEHRITNQNTVVTNVTPGYDPSNDTGIYGATNTTAVYNP